MRVFAVKIQFIHGISKGREGYHSVFADQAAAEFQAALRCAYSSEMHYFVEAFDLAPEALGVNFDRQRIARLPNSNGGMLIDFRTLSACMSSLLTLQNSWAANFISNFEKCQKVRLHERLTIE
jgi:hypothetical protein